MNLFIKILFFNIFYISCIKAIKTDNNNCEFSTPSVEKEQFQQNFIDECKKGIMNENYNIEDLKRFIDMHIHNIDSGTARKIFIEVILMKNNHEKVQKIIEFFLNNELFLKLINEDNISPDLSQEFQHLQI
ncbi:hypothetical protein GF322_00800 [Candidatus Dependentiae bacterium]|nr:hypothetical protein [Candidatus Dependentiae bacterium]